MKLLGKRLIVKQLEYWILGSSYLASAFTCACFLALHISLSQEVGRVGVWSTIRTSTPFRLEFIVLPGPFLAVLERLPVQESIFCQFTWGRQSWL